MINEMMIIEGMVFRAKLIANSLAVNPRKGGRPPSDMILVQIISLIGVDVLDSLSAEILFRFLK